MKVSEAFLVGFWGKRKRLVSFLAESFIGRKIIGIGFSEETGASFFFFETDLSGLINKLLFGLLVMLASSSSWRPDFASSNKNSWHATSER